MAKNDDKVTAKDKLDLALANLVDGVTGVVDSEQFKRWLQTAAQFYNYSFGNQMLIAWQRPSATRVAGFKKWLKLNRCVNKGEKGIMILVPFKGKPKIDEETGEEKHGPIIFGTGYVFDVEQTSGEPLPDLGYVHTNGDDRGDILDACLAVAKAEGLTVDISAGKDNGPSGYLVREAKKIWIKDSLSINGQASTMLHELSHWFDPKLTGEDADPFEYKEHRGERETVAEASAYIAAHHFGFDVGAETFTYVASWAKDVKVLKARLGETSKVAGILINAVEKALGVKVEAEESEAA